MKVNMSEISDADTYWVRKKVYNNVVDDRAKSLREGYAGPAIKVVKNRATGKYDIIDGRHWWLALLEAGIDEIGVIVIQETTDLGCHLEAMKSNSLQGNGLSNADKKRNVRKILNIPDGREMPDTEIAKYAGCSDKTVANWRRVYDLYSENPNRRRKRDRKSPKKKETREDDSSESDQTVKSTCSENNSTTNNEVDEGTNESESKDVTDGISNETPEDLLPKERLKDLVDSMRVAQSEMKSFLDKIDEVIAGKLKVTGSVLVGFQSRLDKIQTLTQELKNLILKLGGER